MFGIDAALKLLKGEKVESVNGVIETPVTLITQSTPANNP
jgi:ribose transport system substrate-binding protein